MTTIHYLQWHRNDPYDQTEASELFHTFHHDPPDTLTNHQFDQLYERVTDVDTDDLEELYARWNRGSGRESRGFLELRYCERCETYIEGNDEAITHTAQNHGYDALHESGDPAYIRGERSLSVGDIVERDGQYYACASIGWQEIELVAPDGGIDDLTGLASSSHRDKLARTVEYLLPYTSAAHGRNLRQWSETRAPSGTE